MNDSSAHIFKQMNQDLAFDKRDPNVYWDALNMELINNGSTLSMVSTSGTETLLELSKISENLSSADSYYVYYNGITYQFARSTDTIIPGVRDNNTQYIIGLSVLRDDLYIITQTEYDLNVVYRYDGNSVVVVYAAYLEMTRNNPLDIISNYENDKVQKLYWVDGINYFRVLNVARENAETLSTLPVEFVDVATAVNLVTPTVIGETNGGNLKSGRIQYGYTLYNRSGQETTLSTFSSLWSISPDNEVGGEPDELVSKALQVEISDLDPDYDSIRVYSIHYDEIGSTPEIKILLDEGISGESFSFVDDGNLFVATTTLDHLNALLGSRYKGNTLNTKKNILFLGDYSVDSFDIDFDARAFSYASNGIAKITDVTYTDDVTVAADYSNVQAPNAPYPQTYDSVNPDPNVYQYESNLVDTGGTGKYVRYRHVTVSEDTNIQGQSFMKRGETYRIGIMFRDGYGRKSPVLWVADTLIPYGGGTINGTGVRLRVFLTDLGTQVARDGGAVGYSVLMVNRSYSDRTILGQGFLVPTYRITDENDNTDIFGGDYQRPYWHIKDITKDNGGRLLDFNAVPAYSSILPYQNDWDFQDNDDTTWVRKIEISDRIMTFHSPDVDFPYSNDINGTSVNIIGYAPLDIPNTKSTYLGRLSDGSPTFGESHEYLKYKYLDGPGDTSLDGKTLFSTADLKLPDHFYGPVNDTEGFSLEAYHWRPYNDIVVKDNWDVENVLLQEQTSLVKSGTTKPVQGNSVIFDNSNYILNFTGGGAPARGVKQNNETSMQNCVVMTFQNTTWNTTNPGVSPKFDKFIDVTTQADQDRSLPIVDLKRDIQNQYGGKSFETRRRNQYIEISDFKYLSDGNNSTDTTTTQGDCFIETYYMKRQSGQKYINNNTWHMYEMVKMRLESYIDTSNRYDDEQYRFDGDYTDCYTILTDSYYYNSAYSQQPNVIVNIPKPYNFQDVTSFDTGIIATGIKYNNEIIDSWTSFQPLETMQLDGEYGKLIKLEKLKGELIAFQPRAVSALSILPRVQVQANDGVNLELGSGQVLDDFNYITTSSGSLNKWSIKSVFDDIFYYDYYNKSVSSLKEGSLSTKHGLQELVTTNHIANEDDIIRDNPLIYSGALTTFDPNNKNLYFSLLGRTPMTLSYNLLTGSFVSQHSFTPTIATNYNGEFVSTDNINKLYKHIHNYDNTLNRTLYDSTFKSYITILSAKDPLIRKKFGNVEFDIKGDDVFNLIEAWNDYQTSGEVLLVNNRSGNLRKMFNKYRISIPREENTRSILADTKLWVKLMYDPDQLNQDGKGTVISNIILNNAVIKYVK